MGAIIPERPTIYASTIIVFLLFFTNFIRKPQPDVDVELKNGSSSSLRLVDMLQNTQVHYGCT